MRNHLASYAYSCCPVLRAAGGATLAYHFILIWDWQSAVGSRRSKMASGQEARAAAAAAAGMLSGSSSSWPLIRARKHVYSARPLAPRLRASVLFCACASARAYALFPGQTYFLSALATLQF